ncbi:MAG: (d)CMP kinase [Clostridiales bacterium]|nr:(d)CMP kinase [Clostridiales bacterium]
MVTANSDSEPYHIYLNGARALRTDLTDVYAIALDGPSGAGKSTVAKLVSKELKITYLDTGALYRALGLVCLDNGVDVKDGNAVEKCIKDVNVDIVYQNGVQIVTADGVDVSSKIRTPEVSMAASAVSAIPYVRQKLLGLQRGIAEKSSVILDGRDIGTVVLPRAEFKFFLTASAQVRAKRRFDELIAKGQTVVYEDVYNDVVTRDKNDSTRAVAPLKCAFDATEINSDNMTAEQVAAFICSTVNGDVL